MFEWELVKCVTHHFIPNPSEANLKKAGPLKQGRDYCRLAGVSSG